MRTTYVYSNRTSHAAAHHRYLSQVLDPYTHARIQGLTELRGKRCLVPGAGGGSVAVFLAGAVGSGGRAQVVATDKEPMPIPGMRRLTVLRHDIVHEPVPQPPYDLVHARLLLSHLPEREAVLRTLASSHVLAPDGLLVVEDWDQTWPVGRVLRAPSEAARRLWELFHDTLVAVFADAGVDPGWASRVPSAMVDAGLQDVQADYHTRSWRGGEAGCLLVAGTAAQLRDKLIDHGMRAEDLDRVRGLMLDPTMMIRMPPLVSVAGWRR